MIMSNTSLDHKYLVTLKELTLLAVVTIFSFTLIFFMFLLEIKRKT